MSDDNFEKPDRYDPYALEEDDDMPEGSVTGGSDDDNSETNTPTDENVAENNGESENAEAAPAATADGKSSGDGAKSDIGSDIIRGHINTIILRALYERDKYGYEIMSDIEHKSHGQYSLKQPTLYSALKRLENQGYIRAYWKTDEVSNGGRRKYFTLTESGKEITEKNLAEWEYSRTIIDSLISDRSFDFSQPAPTPVDFTILRNSVSRVPVLKNGQDGEQENDGQTESVESESKTEADEAVKDDKDESLATESILYELLSAQSAYDQTIEYLNLSESAEQKDENEDSDGAQDEKEQSEEASEQTEISDDEAPSDGATTPSDEGDSLLFEDSGANENADENTEILSDESDEILNVNENPTAEESAFTDEENEIDEDTENEEYGQTAQQPATQPAQPVQPAQPIDPQAESRRIAHENYLRLISEPVRSQEPPREDIVPNSQNVDAGSLLYNNRPETERDYKNLIDGIFLRAVSNGGATAPQSRQTPAEPQVKPKNDSRMRLIDRARADGVAVYASDRESGREQFAAKTTYNKGLTLFKCAAVVLSIIALEFVLCFVFLKQLQTTWVYPAVILLIGLVQFVIFGILALNGYGKNSVKPTTNGYISSCVILTVIGVLIISALSFLLKMNPTSASDVLKMIVIPAVTTLNLTVFALCFKAFVK